MKRIAMKRVSMVTPLLVLVSMFAMAATVPVDTVVIKNNDIYLSVGSGPMMPLTHDGIPKDSPLFSKDGSRIAYAERADRAGAIAVIIVIDRHGQELNRVYVHPQQGVGGQEASNDPAAMLNVEQMEWLNSSRIAVSGEVNPSSSENLIFDLPAHGLPKRFFDDGSVDYSPDGAHFAFEGGMPHFAPVASWMPTLNVDDNDVPVYAASTPNSHITFISAPAWSPDSRTLAVLVRDSQASPLKLVTWHAGGAVTTALLPATATAALLPAALDDKNQATVFYGNGGWVVTSKGGSWQLSTKGKSFLGIQGDAARDPSVAARALRIKLELATKLPASHVDFWCQSCSLSKLPRRTGTL
jgi:hypothetical protein